MSVLPSILLSVMVFLGNEANASVVLKVTDVECYDLMRAATAVDRMDLVNLLIRQDCGVNRPEGSQSMAPTPLHIAIINRNQPMAKMLREEGADMKAMTVFPREIESGKPMCKYLMQDSPEV